MLESLSIRNLGLIQAAEIDFAPGLVVISGETGAGKTLLLDAVSALAGGKPGFTGGAGDTSVDGLVRLPSSSLDSVADVGGEIEDGAVTVSRVFPVDGRARAVIGGRPVPAAMLAELAAGWLAVHGQHDTLRLLKASTHRDLLDRHGGAEQLELVARYSAAFGGWRGLERQLAEATAALSQLETEAASIRADLALCESMALRPGEDVEIATTIERLSRVEQIRQAVGFSVEAIVGDEASASTLLGQAAHQLEHATTSDAELANLVLRLRTVQSELADVAAEAARLLDEVEIEPAALDALMLRQRQIKSLVARHGPSYADLLQWRDAARERLALLDPDNSHLAELDARRAAAAAETRRLAAQLTAARRGLAERLATEVTTELQALAMPFASFSVRVDPMELSDRGSDRVEFAFSANPGLAPQPIQQSASGGELSRLMLAIEVVLAGDDAANSPSVMVFDEVDAGVAGAAATSVAERLARLAQTRQVLVVSHLAQIAAFADQQVVVSKDSDGLVTQTSIRSVTPDERILEIARMLAGLEDSKAAQQHAVELLQNAKQLKEMASG